MVGNSKKTNKKPQIEVPLELIELDDQNPRLSDEYRGKTQIDLIKILYNDFNLIELAYSMAENGYFDEEPIVVVPKNIPDGFKIEDLQSIEECEQKIELLIKEQKIKFIVVEGNRRIATAKILTDKNLKGKLGISDEKFPAPKNDLIENDLKKIPSIFYERREEVSPYLGIRHIIGLLKWEAYSKALYISSRIEEERNKGNDIGLAIKEIQNQIADRTDVIKKQFYCFKLVEQAKNDINFPIQGIKDRFSLLYTAIGYKPIRDFIALPSIKDSDLTKDLVSNKNLEKFKKLLTWIFGDSRNPSLINDARLLASRLSPVLGDKDATEYLIKYNDLQQAYERSGGELEFLKKQLSNAERNLKNSASVVNLYASDQNVRNLITTCEKLIEGLKKVIE